MKIADGSKLLTVEPFYFIQVDDWLMWPDDVDTMATLEQAEQALPMFPNGKIVSCNQILKHPENKC